MMFPNSVVPEQADMSKVTTQGRIKSIRIAEKLWKCKYFGGKAIFTCFCRLWKAYFRKIQVAGYLLKALGL